MIKANIPRERASKDKEDVKAILRHTKVNLKTLKNKAREEKTISLFG
jgi:hypothetical protein